MKFCSIPASLGEMISIHRTRLKISQTELAQAAGVSRNYISQIERGNENVSYSVLLRILERLGLELRMNMKEDEDA